MALINNMTLHPCLFFKSKDVLFHNEARITKFRKWILLEYYYLVYRSCLNVSYDPNNVLYSCF